MLDFLLDTFSDLYSLSDLIESSHSLIDNIDTMIYELTDLGYAFFGIGVVFTTVFLLVFIAQFIVITVFLVKINNNLKKSQENKINPLKDNILSN